MELTEDLARIAAEAERFADRGEELTGVLPAEAAEGQRVYLCAYDAGEERRSWLALDDEGRPVEARSRVRDAVSILALCELAEEAGEGSADTPRIASPAHLDKLGSTLDAVQAQAIASSSAAVDELKADVEANYKVELS